MNLLIPLSETNNDYIELRYALRSITQFYAFKKVLIVGSCPAWVKNVNHIEYPGAALPKYKERNIIEKCITGLFDLDEALIMHDDHFILEPAKPWFHGTIKDKMQSRAGSVQVYRHTVKNTAKVLGENHPWFDVHCPFFANYKRMKEVGTSVNWARSYGYGLKTLYLSGQPGIEAPDAKGFMRKPYFSTNGCLLPGMRELWPEPSPYEK